MIQVLTEYIREWSIEKGLDAAEPSKQLNKFLEEAGELASGLNKKNEELLIDSIGDVYVTLVILSQQLGLEIEDCIQCAWYEIKDRKGKMVDGTFVKESDL